MKPIAGLNRDVNPIDQPPDTLRYAANGIISESTGLAQNIRDEKFWDNFKLDGNDRYYLGQCLGDELVYVWMYNVTLLRGEIWRYDPKVPGAGAGGPIITDPGNILELDDEYASDKILQIVYQSDFEDHEVFVWAGQVRPKIIDIGGIIEDSGPIPIDLDAAGYKTKDFLLYPEGELPNPFAEALNSGGNMQSGAWMFCYRYVYDDLSNTSFSGLSNPVYITEESFDKDEFFEGDAGNRPTNKSAKLTFMIDTTQNADIRIQIGFISIREGVTYAGILDSKLLSRFTAGTTTATYVYTGEDPVVDLGDDISELITPKANYNYIGTITSLTSRLYAGNLTRQTLDNIQDIANNVTVGWEIAGDGNAQLEKGKTLNNQTFGPGEVYALYISVMYANGEESAAHHIPGRKTVAGDEDAIVVDGDNYERWQVYDTVTGTDCGYWVNLDEDYPPIPEFAGALDTGATYETNVRHHKLPSMGYLFHNGILGTPYSATKLNFVINDIDLSSLGPEVVGYKIYYAKRRIGEYVNLTYDFATPAGQEPGALQEYVSIAGGFAYGDQNPTDPPNTTFGDVTPSDEILRFHSLFLMNSRPAIQPQYLVREGFWASAGTTIGLIVDSDTYTDIAGNDNQTLDNAYKYGGFTLFASGPFTTADEVDRYSKIDDYAYVKNGAQIGLSTSQLNNNVGEDCFAVFSNDGFNGPNAGEEVIPTPANLVRFGANVSSTVLPYCALRTVPANISASFDNQTLISAGAYERQGGGGIEPTKVVDGQHGDMYTGVGQFNTTGVAGMGPDPLAVPAPPDPGARALIETSTDENGIFKGEGSKIVYVLPSVQHINHAAQYVPLSDQQSYIAYISAATGFPFTGSGLPYDQDSLSKLKSWYFYFQDIYESQNFYYSSDFNAKSEYFIGTINDGFQVFNEKLPTTIAFSLQQPTDLQIRQWRNWLLLNKYVQPSEKGEIVNLRGAGNQVLYIHHRYSLYLTKDRLTLEGNTANVTLGSGDIFEVTPYEIVSVDEGHTGIANRHYQTLSPFGYSWIQNDHNKIYSHNGQSLDEISGRGMRVYFKDNLVDNDNKDEACFIINDDLRRRVLVGFNFDKTTDEQGRVIAYSTQGQFWSFFQDMTKIYPIVARDKRVFMWGVDDVNARIYAVAEGNFDNLNRPFIVEVVMQDGTANHKYLQFLKWDTNVWDTSESNIDYFDLETETFNKAVIYSDTKIWGEPAGDDLSWLDNLIPYLGFPKGDQNVRRLEDNWALNAFRDLSTSGINIQRSEVDNLGPNPAAVDETLTWDKKARIRDKYVIVRFFYQKDNNYQIDLQSIEFGVKPSFR